MTPSENLNKAVCFEKPEWIPMVFHINQACWYSYPREELIGLKADHPLLFPGYNPDNETEPKLSEVQRADQPYTDPWGCTWETTRDGIVGTVHKHPLANWADFEQYHPPDPEKTDGVFPVNWGKKAEELKSPGKSDELFITGLPHGHTFLRLCDIRGYENLMFDMADDNPNLSKLIGMIEEFNAAVINRYIEIGSEWMYYPEDLGMQSGPMISPEHFRKYIKPVYQRLMKPAREKGLIVHMHSDGDIRTLAEDLVDGGVEILNLQDLVNGIGWIAEHFKGRVCIELDIDRQRITAKGTPKEIDSLIREEVETLGSPDGGLMMIYGLYPGVPMENARALMDAMERYMGFFS